MIDIITAIKDPNLIGDTISDAQEVCLRAMYGLSMTDEQIILLNRLKGEHFDDEIGEVLPGAPEDTSYEPCDYRESTFVVGRRGGKSDKLAANVAIYEAFFRDHAPYLSVGEEAYVLCLSQTMRTKVVFNYILGKIQNSPLLSKEILEPKSEEIPIKRSYNLSIRCWPCSHRSIRGPTYVCIICDEIGFWEVEGVNPDGEVLAACRPGMATIPYARMVKISSPYLKAGELWKDYEKRGRDLETFVVRAPTVVLNPTATDYVRRERSRENEEFGREFRAEFGEGTETFLPHAAIADCIMAERHELEYRPQYYYKAAMDAAFKSDKFTFAIGYRSPDKRVIAVLRDWQGTGEKPVSLKEVITEITRLCWRYRITSVVGDQHCAQPIREALAANNIGFTETRAGGAQRRDAYLTLKALITQRAMELLDHDESIRELQNLEIRRTAGGNFNVGHPRHGTHSDDFADSIALVAEQLDGPYSHPVQDEADVRAHDAWIAANMDPATGYFRA